MERDKGGCICGARAHEEKRREKNPRLVKKTSPSCAGYLMKFYSREHEAFLKRERERVSQ